MVVCSSSRGEDKRRTKVRVRVAGKVLASQQSAVREVLSHDCLHFQVHELVLWYTWVFTCDEKTCDTFMTEEGKNPPAVVPLCAVPEGEKNGTFHKAVEVIHCHGSPYSSSSPL